MADGLLNLPGRGLDLSQHRILVTNDDGINSYGLELLESIARKLSDDVWVVAPESEQSGAGHSLTLHQPLRFHQLADRRFTVTGTPTDCVLMAVTRIIEGRRPTLILSGINRGSNLGEDITYSGTVAAAIEGTLLGIPSLALSQTIFPTRWQDGPDWRASEVHTEQVVRFLMSVDWPKDTLMNVNFPDLREGQVKDLDITKQGRRDLQDIALEERKDTRGQTYFWIGFRKSYERLAEHTDIKTVREGVISVTPVFLDFTHTQFRDVLLRHKLTDDGER